jgi:hypothetical protein
VRRFLALVCGPKTPFKQQLMNACLVIVVTMWKKKLIHGKEDNVPYANELQPSTMETRLKVAFTFFHTEGALYRVGN